MNTRLSTSIAVLSATLFVPSWAQAPVDASVRPRPVVTSISHLAVGTVTSVDAAGRSVTIDHQAIPSLNMPAMAMQFRLQEAPTPPLKAGQSIAFTLTASAEGLTIGSVQAVNAANGFASSRPQPDHSMSGMEPHAVQGMGEMKGMNGMKGMKDMKDMKGMKGMMDMCGEMMGGR